jgi:3-hydroxybutyryl-CoA dehydrogenase
MMSPIKTVAVLGAGTMGQGIAQVCATAGYQTILFDIQPALLEKALLSIEQNLDGAIAKGKLTIEKKKAVLENLKLANSLSELKADLVIEAVVEKLEVKQKLFAELEKINEPQCILTSNTSSISITQISSVLNNKSNCVGLHFFNPAHVMKLVEIVATEFTNKELMVTMKDFVQSLNKISVETKDSPGFIVNRVARHYYTESLKLVEDKVASVESIDKLLRSAGFKMGPFELMDLIGIDVNLAVTTSLYDSFQHEVRFKPSQIQQQKVLDKQLGRKTGKGFYEYTK